MNKKIVIPASAIILLLSMTAFMPLAYATKSSVVTGKYVHLGHNYLEPPRMADGNMILIREGWVDHYAGDFIGSGHGLYEKLVVHPNSEGTGQGFTMYEGTIELDGEVYEGWWYTRTIFKFIVGETYEGQFALLDSEVFKDGEPYRLHGHGTFEGISGVGGDFIGYYHVTPA